MTARPSQRVTLHLSLLDTDLPTAALLQFTLSTDIPSGALNLLRTN